MRKGTGSKTRARRRAPGRFLLAGVLMLLALPAMPSGKWTPQLVPRMPQAAALKPPGSQADIVAAQATKAQEIDTTRMIQRAMIRLGLYSGPIDGVIGNASGYAVLRFLREAGLPQTMSRENLESIALMSMMVVGRGAALDQARRDLPVALQLHQSFQQATQLFDRGGRAEGEQRLGQIRAESERVFGPNSDFTFNVIYAQSTAAFLEGRRLEAEDLLRRYYPAMKAALGDDHTLVLWVRDGLATALASRGRFIEAERMHRDNYELRKARLGPNDPDTLASEIDLGYTAILRGAYMQALPPLQAALGRLRRHHPEEIVKIAVALMNIGQAFLYLEHADIAERYLGEAVDITSRAGPAQSGRLLAARIAYAHARLTNGHAAEAETILAPLPAKAGAETPADEVVRAQGLTILATALTAQGRYREAETHALESVRILSRQSALWKPEAMQALHALAAAVGAAGEVQRALGIYASMLPLFDRYISQNPNVSPAHVYFARKMVQTYLSLMASDRSALTQSDIRASFGAQSVWTYDALEVTLNDLGARLRTGHPESEKVVREYQELRERLQLLRTGYNANFVGAGVETTANLAAAPQLKALEARFDEVARVVDTEVPEVAELLTPKTMSANEVQALLAPGEALVAFALTDEAAYSWLVRKDRVDWAPIRLSRNSLVRVVQRIRAGVDLAVPPATPPPEANCALGSAAPILANRPFDTCAAEVLYKQLFGGFDLDGIDHLIVVADGPLETLPFSLLVATRKGDGQPEWMIERHALSTLPTTSSLRALRSTGDATVSQARYPFLGIAPGEFSGHAHDSPLAMVPPNLPGTMTEVKALSMMLDASDSGVVTGTKANESFVKAAPLADYRVLSFATHGLTAEEAAIWTDGAITEPALVLSGPTDGDDGLLTATEVAQLRLDADWVLLSGCNTAAAGKAGGGGLSGLARAFFFAGARSLLVSHWSIEDLSAEMLMTSTFEAAASMPDIEQAEALRNAMIELMQYPAYDHPFFWAPFELVGEGWRPGRFVANPTNGGETLFALANLDPNAAPPLRGTLGPGFSPLSAPGTAASEAALELDRTLRAEIQQRLTLLGHDTAGIDGDFGRRTRDALSSWQQAAGAPATGFLNARQLADLRSQSSIAFGEWISAGNTLVEAAAPGRTKRRKTGVRTRPRTDYWDFR